MINSWIISIDELKVKNIIFIAKNTLLQLVRILRPREIKSPWSQFLADKNWGGLPNTAQSGLRKSVKETWNWLSFQLVITEIIETPRGNFPCSTLHAIRQRGWYLLDQLQYGDKYGVSLICQSKQHNSFCKLKPNLFVYRIVIKACLMVM